jgi:hypothetical protein
LYTLQERREDTKFTLAHFRKHKRKIHKKLPGSKRLSDSDKFDGIQKPGKDVGNKLANIIGTAADLASNTKPMKVILSTEISIWEEMVSSHFHSLSVGSEHPGS